MVSLTDVRVEANVIANMSRPGVKLLNIKHFPFSFGLLLSTFHGCIYDRLDLCGSKVELSKYLAIQFISFPFHTFK
jgi:hypothetical protein